MSDGKPRAIVSWSSGKDSAFTLQVLREQKEFELVALFTTINQVHDRVAMHAVRRELLRAQAASARGDRKPARTSAVAVAQSRRARHPLARRPRCGWNRRRGRRDVGPCARAVDRPRARNVRGPRGEPPCEARARCAGARRIERARSAPTASRDPNLSPWTGRGRAGSSGEGSPVALGSSRRSRRAASTKDRRLVDGPE